MNIVNVLPSSVPAPPSTSETSVSFLQLSAQEQSKWTEALGRLLFLYLGKWSFTGAQELTENTSLLMNESKFPSDSFAERRKFFQKQDEREAFTFDQYKLYQMEVSNYC